MFLCKVAVGRTMEVSEDMPHLTGREVEGLGFDSVTGVMGDEMGLGGAQGRRLRLHATLCGESMWKGLKHSGRQGGDFTVLHGAGGASSLNFDETIVYRSDTPSRLRTPGTVPGP